ncbi:hypothetical protein KJ765_00675 [Candidatus Micrarchaeota archaeon]|nr:hypothetical protein [Candidatus Micrarchaeota archaeon]
MDRRKFLQIFGLSSALAVFSSFPLHELVSYFGRQPPGSAHFNGIRVSTERPVPRSKLRELTREIALLQPLIRSKDFRAGSARVREKSARPGMILQP